MDRTCCPLEDGAVVPYSVMSGRLQHLLDRTEGSNSSGTQIQQLQISTAVAEPTVYFQSDGSLLTVDGAVLLLLRRPFLCD
jgi:hypothetical protein